MKVLKFGGSSVGSAERIKRVATLITERKGNIVVLSAMSETTNALVNIAKNANYEDVLRLKLHYDKTIYELLSNTIIYHECVDFINEIFNRLKTLIEEPKIRTNEVLAIGEQLSTQLLAYYLTEIKSKNKLLDAREYIRLDTNNEPDVAFIQTHLNKAIHKDTINIIQGFICRDAEGNTSNLKRGGSDYTASLVGEAVNASAIEIWTDIDGFHNNDPRYVEKTESISHLTYDEAAELAYFGAKILHPSTLIPSKRSNIPVWLKNTMNPSQKGTLISDKTIPAKIKAIAAKDGITAIKIKSGRMLLAYGFLSKIFQIFEKHHTAIDMITTSEIAVSLTIDDNSKLTEIVSELEKIGEVEIDHNQSIVCVVGNMIATNISFVSRLFNVLTNIPVRMISYGGSRHNISVLVGEEKKIEVLNLLQANLFRSNETV